MKSELRDSEGASATVRPRDEPPEVRVERLRALLAAGRLPVDAHLVADAMIREAATRSLG